ncbi:DUF473 family protein [Geoglobus sp.]
MRCYVISGISRQVIEEILRGNLRTLELRNVINIATALNAKLGDCVFVTTAKNADLGRGVTGLIAEVEGKEIVSHSTFYARNDYIEECEMTVVRLRIRPRALGRLVQVLRRDILSPVEGEAIQVDHFLAR